LSTEVAVHGGLGVLQKNDIIIALSRGGKTKEILDIIPAIKEKGTLKFIEPGERINYRLEFNILKSSKDIEEFKSKFL